MMLLLVATAFACPALDGQVDVAATRLLSGDYGGATAALASAEESFACAPATTAQIARYWLVKGATLHLRGDTAAARGPLSAARAIAPELFDARLGPDVRAAWASATPAGKGTLLLEPQRPAFVDGAGISEWPITLPATPHVVQVVGSSSEVAFGRVVDIAPGDDALVETGVIAVPPPVEPADTTLPDKPIEKPRAARSPALLIVAGIAAAGAGACAGGAVAQHDQIDGATTLTALDGAFDRQQVFGYSTWGLVGLSAAALTLHFVIP